MPSPPPSRGDRGPETKKATPCSGGAAGQDGAEFQQGGPATSPAGRGLKSGLHRSGIPAADGEQRAAAFVAGRSEEHTSELQSLMRISYAVFCLKKKKQKINTSVHNSTTLHTLITQIQIVRNAQQ